MPLDPVFDHCFAPLIGRPCWQVRIGYSSCLTLDFGDPHLEIREPAAASAEASQRVRELFARRNVIVRGAWHLWLFCCNWTIFDGEKIVGTADDDNSLAAAVRFLDGQALTSFSMKPSATSCFAFDLGGLLEASPFDDTSDLWMLYEPDGHVLILRADGQYKHSLMENSDEKLLWLPAWKQ